MFLFGPFTDHRTKQPIVNNTHRASPTIRRFFALLHDCAMPNDRIQYLTLQRYIPMLLSRVLVALGLQHLQRLDQLLARLSRLDDGIKKAAFRSHIGIG